MKQRLILYYYFLIELFFIQTTVNLLLHLYTILYLTNLEPITKEMVLIPNSEMLWDGISETYCPESWFLG